MGVCTTHSRLLSLCPRRPHPRSDFCHIPGSRCDEDGNVIELNLRSFSLQCTTFPVDELGLLSKLQKLDLSNNIDLVEGQDDDMSQVAKYLNDVDSLQYIDLSNTGIGGDLQSSTLCSSSNRLIKLKLDGNSLSGEVPKCLMESTTLLELSLSRNSFSGAIPNLAADSQMEMLNLHTNNFTSDLPYTLFTNGLHLKAFDIHDNKITGEIPADIGTASPSLTLLNMANNSLSGMIPVSLATNGLNLDVLDLSRNMLSSMPQFDNGSAVDWMGRGFYMFSLSDNMLEGTFPDLSDNPEVCQ